ncbi:MAG TPA: hypothetical protein VHO25_02740, partial [Polyangiaceae bacterium]|nr:hypothetical protein [Polyangiaceae bacterium]
MTYYYSACVAISGDANSVLCDPWFTDGAYDGSWFQFPKLENPIHKIGRHRYVYISHIHPDHLDLKFLHDYCRKFSDTELLIANFKKNYLARKLREAGLPFRIADDVDLGDFKVRIFPNDQGHVFDVDSALVAIDNNTNHVVVNMNDNDFNATMIDQIKTCCGSSPEIALLGYTGAGPYPQTYHQDPSVLLEKAEAKKIEFFRRYRRMRDTRNPKVTIPFAGKYWLGGKLVGLNAFRGVADAVDILNFDERAVVLADGGDSSIDTATLRATSVRTLRYEEKAIQDFLKSIQSAPMDYERNFRSLSVHLVPFKTLLP